jgi:hypothetical protein
MSMEKIRKSGLSKLPHLCKRLLFACFYLTTLSPLFELRAQAYVTEERKSSLSNPKAQRRVIAKDRYLFKVADSAVSLNEAAIALKELQILNCFLGESVFFQLYRLEDMQVWQKVLQEIYAKGFLPEVITEGQSALIKIRSLWKLKQFVSSQNVVIHSQVEKSLQEDKSCGRYNVKFPLKNSFLSWLKVDVFLRARFNPEGVSVQEEWRKKRLSAAQLLLESIEAQVPHENYW